MKTGKAPLSRRIIQRVRSWRRGIRLGVIASLTLAAIGLMLALPPIPQPPGYHQFADQRAWLGIPHFLNVISNLPLSLAGAMGLAALRRGSAAPGASVLPPAEYAAVQAFFLGALLTGMGSAYYHWAPDNPRLLWDRLPMTLCFMAFLAIALGGRVSEGTVRWGLPVLTALGLASVIHWHLGEQRGVGDLRWYGFMQFFPALLIPVVLLLFPSRYAGDGDILAVLAIYTLALLCDQILDGPLFALGGLIAAFAVYRLLRGLRRRAALAAKRAWASAIHG